MNSPRVSSLPWFTALRPFLFGSVLAAASGLAGIHCTGAADSELFAGSDDARAPQADGSDVDGSSSLDAGDTTPDGGNTTTKDAGNSDAGKPDSGPLDSGPPDTGPVATIACAPDAGTDCTVGSQTCCRSVGSVFTCGAVGACTGVSQLSIPCDDARDCDALGHPGELCCGSTNGTKSVREVSCRKANDCSASGRVKLCDPEAADPCPNGGTCRVSTQTLAGFWVCL